jgi:hypothetical protein
VLKKIAPLHARRRTPPPLPPKELEEVIKDWVVLSMESGEGSIEKAEEIYGDGFRGLTVFPLVQSDYISEPRWTSGSLLRTPCMHRQNMRNYFGVASQLKKRGDASCLIYILSALQITST